MRYLKAVIAGIVFAAFVEVLGLAVGVLKCLVSGLPIRGSALLSVALGVGAREAVFAGLVITILMLVGTPRPRPPR
jgi:hypothetical protein